MPLLFLYDNKDGGVEEWRGFLIDFDWSRHVGVWNTHLGLTLVGKLNRQREPAAEIKQRHDLDMFEKTVLYGYYYTVIAPGPLPNGPGLRRSA